MAVKDFTQGGQTALQNIRLFFAIFGKLVTIFVVVFVLSFAGIFYLKTTPYQRYELAQLAINGPMSGLIHGIGGAFVKIGLATPSDTEVFGRSDFKTPDGFVLELYPPEVVQLILTKDFVYWLKWRLIFTMIEATLLGLMFDVFLAKLLMSYGKKISATKTLRGTRLTTPKVLARLVNQANGKNESGLAIANIPLPYRAETKHIWINGTVGSGKTVAFSELMAQVRAKKQRAIVYDIMGVLTAQFYRPNRDIILNPFDARSPAWDIWAECEKSVDYETIAASLIPIIPGTQNQDPFWTKAARAMVAATARRLAKTSGDARPKTVQLLRYLLTADLAKLQDLLKDTEAESLVSEKLEKTALSVKAVLNDYVKSMRFLPDAKAGGEVFSIKRWLSQKEDDSWLFITSKSNYHETLMPLISTWYDVAITAALSLPQDEKRRLYCFLDELPTLQYLSSLKKGIAQGRQFGLCFVLGTQDVEQLNVSYGADNAKTLIANCNTKIILRTIDSGEEIAKLFNQSEVQERNQSTSFGVTDYRDGISISEQKQMRYVVLPSELQSLSDLEFYLKLPGDLPITKSELKYVKYPTPEPALVPRDRDVDWLVDNEAPAVNTPSEDAEKPAAHLDGVAEGMPVKPPVEKETNVINKTNEQVIKNDVANSTSSEVITKNNTITKKENREEGYIL